MNQLIFHDIDPDIKCKECFKKDKENLMLLCENCGNMYHTYCHEPKITSIP